MSGMLTAINDFVQDSFNTEGDLGSIDYGNNKIILQREKHSYLAAVVYGEIDNYFKGKMIKVDSQNYISQGRYAFDKKYLIIVELPIGLWSQDYKDFLDDKDIQNVENKYIRFNEVFNKSQKNLNIFYILPRTIRDEASHSQFLAWLLNPEASHGLGYEFLYKFLFKSVGIEKEKFIRIDTEKSG